jgi:Ser/Thr protein kinase RdoA (MazF antagonist)
MPVLEALTRIWLDHEQQACLGVSSDTLTLRRASPRSAEHMLVEYVTSDGRRIPGQWFRDPERCAEVAHQTVKAARRAQAPGHTQEPPCMVWQSPANAALTIVLQSPGADRRLTGLLPLLDRPGATLLVHHPERRAVVRLPSPDRLQYAKVVPPARAGKLVANGQAARSLAASAFATPRLLAVDNAAGVAFWSELSGTPLFELLAGSRLTAAVHLAGAALRALHAAPPRSTLRLHHACDEAALLQTWVARTTSFVPELGGQLDALLPGIQARLSNGSAPHVPIHRDFYDKQIFVDGDGIGILDFDTLAYGEAALDLGNMLAHIELRTLQGRLSPAQAAAAAGALLQPYRPTEAVRTRLVAYLDAARLRLACVYAFRPAWHHLSPVMLERIRQRKSPQQLIEHHKREALWSAT